MIFLCPQLTSQDSSGTFAASFRVSLATGTTGLWKEASTEDGFQHPSLQRMTFLSAETSRLERQGQGNGLGPGAAVLYQTLGHGELPVLGTLKRLNEVM